MRSLLFQLAVVGAAPIRDWAGYTFEAYVEEFGKSYAEEQLILRKSMFDDEIKQVVEHNVAYLAGEKTWFAELNEYSDWTEVEFMQLKKGKSKVEVVTHTVTKPPGAIDNPTRKDWREENVTTPVKNQQQCGSCWAFGSTEVMESHYAINTGELLILAPQAYVNCAPNLEHCGGSGGCKGSIPELAFNFSAQLGLPLESDLPYNATDEVCTPYRAAVINSGYVKLPENDADALETTLANVGPVAVNLAANWGRYGGGIFSGSCNVTSCMIDHVVPVVGYDKSGEGYWIARNSWGPKWGEGGYIRLSRKNDAVVSIDHSPGTGTGCLPYPQSQRVMGEGGLLFDVSYPTGVRAASPNFVTIFC